MTNDERIGYVHVDVFATAPYTGNSVTVVDNPPPLTDGQLARITSELRHFETIFLNRTDSAVIAARVFDLDAELPFAGHPVLGAAAVQHLADPDGADRRRWQFALPARTVTVDTIRTAPTQFEAVLDQGRPEFGLRPEPSAGGPIAEAFGLTAADLHPVLRPAVVSTGLRYLIVPVTSADALGRARIVHPDLDGLLSALGADFAYLLAPDELEGRHWNNDGIVEDIATGSAAGCVAAYLLQARRAASGESLILHQGRFAGRPAQMRITAYGEAGVPDRVTVGGDVTLVATGHLHTIPEP